MIDFTNEQGASNGGVGVNERAATAGGGLSIEPKVDRVRIEPKCEASSVDESGDIVRPVTDVVTPGGFIHSRTRLPDLAHP